MKLAGIWALILSCLLFAGCIVGGYYTNVPPPAARVEVVGVAPGPEFVWINGYWGLSGGVHVWVPGIWVRPPYRGAVWIVPHWERHYGRYYFYEGHWR